MRLTTLQGAGSFWCFHPLQESVVEKLIEVHSFFGVALEETQEKVGQFRAGTVRNPGQHIRNFYANFRPPSLDIAEQVEH